MWKRLIAASLIFGSTAAAPPAFGQAACGLHDQVSKNLQDKYGEAAVGRGLQSETRLLEVWNSPDSGTWTILIVRPDGLACVLASGIAWTDVEPPPQGVNG